MKSSWAPTWCAAKSAAISRVRAGVGRSISFVVGPCEADSQSALEGDLLKEGHLLNSKPGKAEHVRPKFVPENYYHVFNRGNEKQTIFFERENFLFFLRRLKNALQKQSTELICYCLMPNHFHLVLKEIIENGISSVMLSLQTSYAKAINKRYNRVGHLFQGPFKHIHIDRDEYLLHLSRYIHINPVEAGLVSKPEAWEFSSFRDYIALRKGLELKHAVELCA